MELQLLPAGYNLQHVEHIDSTNAELKRQCISGNGQHKRAFLADVQLAGKGRRAREWVSEAGNLFVSFSHSITFSDEAINGYSLAAGLAVRETIAHYLPSHKVEWKWPNDVLLEGKKASGILLEHVKKANQHWLITGVGINITSAPKADVMWQSTALNDYDKALTTKEEILKTFVNYLDSYYKRVSNGEIELLTKACLNCAARLGEEIQVRLPNEELTGIFQGIDTQGNLILAHESGQKLISAGDIFFKE